MEKLPLFYFPSTTVLVDDDPLFSQALTETLKNQLQLITYESPLDCLEFFNSYNSFLYKMPLLRERTDCDNYGTHNHLPVDINQDTLIKIMNFPNKKSEISVLIVDYRMPKINGIELCRELKNMPVKKILLTGEADDSLAISAFNEGIIDCFIKKDNPNLAHDIIQYINALSNDYLFEYSKTLLEHLEVENKIPFSDPVFSSFFKKWCKENTICEYAIFDKQGNLEAIDNFFKKFHFIVHTEKTLNTFVESYQESNEATEFIQHVRERKKIPFFGIGLEGWQHSYETWKKCFYVPQILKGREKYYWFVIKDR